jgi:cytochrome b involved in lipid metabolism
MAAPVELAHVSAAKREWTRAAVAAESARRLVIIDNDVYDITDFAREHPGGASLLEDYFGRDASADFRAIGHSTAAVAWRDRLRIGTVVLAERIELPPRPVPAPAPAPAECRVF